MILVMQFVARPYQSFNNVLKDVSGVWTGYYLIEDNEIQ